MIVFIQALPGVSIERLIGELHHVPHIRLLDGEQIQLELMKEMRGNPKESQSLLNGTPTARQLQLQDRLLSKVISTTDTVIYVIVGGQLHMTEPTLRYRADRTFVLEPSENIDKVYINYVLQELNAIQANADSLKTHLPRLNSQPDTVAMDARLLLGTSDSFPPNYDNFVREYERRHKLAKSSGFSVGRDRQIIDAILGMSHLSTIRPPRVLPKKSRPNARPKLTQRRRLVPLPDM